MVNFIRRACAWSYYRALHFRQLLIRGWSYLQGRRLKQGRIAQLEATVAYLEHETLRLASLVRYLAAPVMSALPLTRQTRSSFDFQWDRLPPGRWNLENADFRKEAAGYVCQFTGLEAAWFKGKKVVDVGCGAGRYSWALCTLKADVLSIDQSEHGLQRTQEACRAFSGHRVKQVNLLQPLNIEETFDLVWSYGVLHHTGDTYGAFRRIVPLVKPGGYLFLMLYGAPRPGMRDDYDAVNTYEWWRRKTRNLSATDRLETITRAVGEGVFGARDPLYIEGYFDAISPTINDLYTWEEIEGWLLLAGFVHIRRTSDMRNHHVIAQQPSV